MNRPQQAEPVRTVMWAKLAWFAFVLVLAAGVTGIELDTSTFRHPANAPYVPAFFRNESLKDQFNQALDGSDSTNPLSLASTMVERDPLAAESLSRFGQAAAMVKRVDLSSNAFVLAQGRGWRDAATQRIAADFAIASGQWDVAALRLAALWKGGNDPDQMAQETMKLLSMRGGAKYFAQMMVAGGAGLRTFIDWAPQHLSKTALINALTALREAGYKPDCEYVSERSTAMLSGPSPGSAVILWRLTCGGARDTEDALLRFAPRKDGRVAGPFDWTYPGATGVELHLERIGSDSVLRYVNSDPLTQTIAVRAATLAPGPHRVAMRQGGSSDESGVTLRLLCSGANGARSVGSVPLGTNAGDLVVPAGCPVQKLTIEVATGAGTIGAIRID